MNWMLFVTLVGLYALYCRVYLIAGHRRELATNEALYRIFRWWIVVSATWVVVAGSLHLIQQIDIKQAFTLTPYSKTSEPQEVRNRVFLFLLSRPE